MSSCSETVPKAETVLHGKTKIPGSLNFRGFFGGDDQI